MRKIPPLQYLVLLYSLFHGLSGVIFTLAVALKTCMAWYVGTEGIVIAYEIVQLFIGVFVFLITLGIKKHIFPHVLAIMSFVVVAVPVTIGVASVLTGVVNIPAGVAIDS